jgi:hypothetical protein
MSGILILFQANLQDYFKMLYGKGIINNGKDSFSFSSKLLSTLLIYLFFYMPKILKNEFLDEEITYTSFNILIPSAREKTPFPSSTEPTILENGHKAP